MFSLHVIQAEFGDCLLLEYGAAAPRYMLIDGGPPDVFDSFLKPALRQIVAPHGGRLEHVVLSHVDNDHVVGLIDLFTEIRTQRTNGQPELVSIAGLWHNSFSKALDPNNVLGPRLNALMAMAGVQSTMSDSAVSINGIGEGDKLRRLARLLNIPINQNLPDPITVESAVAAVPFDNLQLRVVGPTQANLDALREEWEDWLDANESRIANGDVRLMANADQSIPNLSSICVVAAADAKTMLLTGDARSDHILQGLQARGMLDAAGRAHFDLIKLPHHGSDRNITKAFFRKVTADRYVASANGKDKNPDLATLIWLVEAAKEQNRTPDIFVTNQTPSTKKLVQEYPPQYYGYRLHILPAADESMQIVLA